MSPSIDAALMEMHREGYSLVRERGEWSIKLDSLHLLRPLLAGQDATERELLSNFGSPYEALVSYGQTLLALRAQ